MVVRPAVATSRAYLPKRRSNRRNMMLMATIGFLVAGCSSGATPSSPAAADPKPGSPRVVFYAEGSGTKSGAVTMRSESGGVIQLDVALPMTNTQTGTAGLESVLFKRGADLYMSLQNSEAAGSVTCRIEVDGKKVDEATSSGAYKIATCQGRVP